MSLPIDSVAEELSLVQAGLMPLLCSLQTEIFKRLSGGSMSLARIGH